MKSSSMRRSPTKAAKKAAPAAAKAAPPPTSSSSPKKETMDDDSKAARRVNVLARMMRRPLQVSLCKSMILLTISCFVLVSYTILSSRQVRLTTGTSSPPPPPPPAAMTASSVLDVENKIQQQEQQHPLGDHSREFPAECSIFMAPSSIKGHPGFGIFTTRDIAVGGAFLQAPDGPSIPVVGLDRTPRSNSAIVKQFTSMFNDYWWGRGVSDAVFFEDDTVIDYQITFGSLPNHHCLLDSLDNRQPMPVPYDDSLLDRFSDPGVGAYSYSMGRSFVAKRTLQAGDEIFLNYGHCSRTDNQYGTDQLDWTHTMPMPEDYQKAAAILIKFWKQHGKDDADAEFTPPTNVPATVAMLLPKSRAELDAKLAPFLASTTTNPLKNSREASNVLFRAMAKQMASNPRTPDWIKQHGMCLEHLIPYPSQMPHAGQGALAQHFIGKGDLVVPVPFLHIMDKNALLYPSFHQQDDQDGENVQMSWQVLLNYCFGHEESSFLLCPNTNAILLNHCSSRRDANGKLKHPCGHPDGPNAAYRWSAGDWDPTSPAFLNMTLDEIASQEGRGLSMEIYALRDIHPGDEVFIDYGPEWEEAWDNHVQNTWSPPPRPPQAVPASSSSWLTAKEANLDETAPILDAFVTNDLRQTTIDSHPYLFTGCQYHVSRDDSHDVYRRENFDWKSMSNDDDILSIFSDDASRDYQDASYEWHSDQSHWPCTILFQEEDEEQDGSSSSSLSYTVRIHQSDWYESQPWNDNDLPRILTNYPRSAIHYFVAPGESDQHLPGAFRHAIGIRDEIFPAQWKNRRQEEQRQHSKEVEKKNAVVAAAEERESL